MLVYNPFLLLQSSGVCTDEEILSLRINLKQQLGYLEEGILSQKFSKEQKEQIKAWLLNFKHHFNQVNLQYQADKVIQCLDV